MMKKSISLLASLLLLLPLLTLAAEPRKPLTPKSIDSKNGPVVGQYVPIHYVKTRLVQGCGKFAVFKHNQQKGDRLNFHEVYAGEKQIVAGTNYKLKLSTTIDGLPFKYEAVVFADLTGILHLISFKEIVLLGGYSRIKDVKTAFIQDLGKLVDKDGVKFNEVYEGASQVGEETNYKLLLTATYDGGIFVKYTALVVVDLKNYRYLKSLRIILD